MGSIHSLVDDWKVAADDVVNARIALADAKRNLKLAEGEGFADVDLMAGKKNDTQRKAAVYIYAYPQIEKVDSIQAEIYLAEVERDYRKYLLRIAMLTEAPIQFKANQ